MKEIGNSIEKNSKIESRCILSYVGRLSCHFLLLSTIQIMLVCTSSQFLWLITTIVRSFEDWDIFVDLSSRKMFVGRDIFVGLSSRTNMFGAKAVADAFPEYVTTVVKVPPPALHLKDCVSVIYPQVLVFGKSPAAQKAFHVSYHRRPSLVSKFNSHK